MLIDDETERVIEIACETRVPVRSSNGLLRFDVCADCWHAMRNDGHTETMLITRTMRRMTKAEHMRSHAFMREVSVFLEVGVAGVWVEPIEGVEA